MKRILYSALFLGASFLALGTKADAASSDVIIDGVSIGGVDVSGMTYDEALSAVNNYTNTLSNANVTLNGENGESITVSAADLGLTFANTDIIDKALNIGKSGNVVERYKLSKDAENGGVTFDIEYAFDDTMITDVFENQCSSLNVEASDYSLELVNGSFNVIEGTTGYEIDEDASIEALQTYVSDSFDGSDFAIDLVINVTEPNGSYEELSNVTDVLGTYTTSYSSSGTARSANIANGCKLASGITLYPGDEFSMLDNITPFTEGNGYYLAGSYLNGQVVESFGGGICQVSTTLYNAVLRAELEVTERSNHSMIVTYVDPAMDAAIAENGGKNFKFKNDTDYPIYIYGTTAGKQITFTIYGKETRDSNRTVSFESETLEETESDTDTFTTDSTQALGYVKVTQSAHKGIKAQLVKIVSVNGVEQSREVVNTSTYKMVPRIITVGTAGADANMLTMLNAAIATGSYDQVVATASALASAAASGATVDPTTGAIVSADATAADSTTTDAAVTDGTVTDGTVTDGTATDITDGTATDGTAVDSNADTTTTQ